MDKQKKKTLPLGSQQMMLLTNGSNIPLVKVQRNQRTARSLDRSVRIFLNLKTRNVGSNLWLPKTHPRLKFPFPNTTSSLSDEAMFAGAAIVNTVRKGIRASRTDLLIFCFSHYWELIVTKKFNGRKIDLMLIEIERFSSCWSRIRGLENKYRSKELTCWHWQIRQVSLKS